MLILLVTVRHDDCGGWGRRGGDARFVGAGVCLLRLGGKDRLRSSWLVDNKKKIPLYNDVLLAQ